MIILLTWSPNILTNQTSCVCCGFAYSRLYLGIVCFYYNKDSTLVKFSHQVVWFSFFKIISILFIQKLWKIFMWYDWSICSIVWKIGRKLKKKSKMQRIMFFTIYFLKLTLVTMSMRVLNNRDLCRPKRGSFNFVQWEISMEKVLLIIKVIQCLFLYF